MGASFQFDWGGKGEDGGRPTSRGLPPAAVLGTGRRGKTEGVPQKGPLSGCGQSPPVSPRDGLGMRRRREGRNVGSLRAREAGVGRMRRMFAAKSDGGEACLQDAASDTAEGVAGRRARSVCERTRIFVPGGATRDVPVPRHAGKFLPGRPTRGGHRAPFPGAPGKFPDGQNALSPRFLPRYAMIRRATLQRLCTQGKQRRPTHTGSAPCPQGKAASPNGAAGGKPLLVGLPPSARTAAPFGPKRSAPAPSHGADARRPGANGPVRRHCRPTRRRRTAPARGPLAVVSHRRPIRTETQRARPLLMGRTRVNNEPTALSGGTAAPTALSGGTAAPGIFLRRADILLPSRRYAG